LDAGARDRVSACIVFPTDPMGLVPGGIDTFIRGLLRWAPDDIDMSLIGMTTDDTAWPVGRWHVCNAGGHPFRFYPVLREVGAGVRTPIPLSLRFTLALKARRPLCEADVLEFHRLEPMLPFLFDSRPKNAFFHQDMAVLHDTASDIRWKHVPWLYFGLERLLIPRLSAAFAVREEAVRAYRARYPRLASSIEFIPTWMDPEVFHPADAGQRRALRDDLLNELGFSASSRVLIYVGRWDTQKDPLRLLRAFRALLAEDRDVALVLVGDGVLRGELQAFVRSHGLDRRVALSGPRPQPRVADWLRAADLFVLSSAYEGMPMSVLEALGSGLPVATTDVGEVRRVVWPGVNGEIARSRSVEDLVRAMADCLDRLDTYAGAPCTEAVADYVPRKVLAPVYETYRALAARVRRA
jgi:glycosyltransferase involved in cell wall biosynthesis